MWIFFRLWLANIFYLEHRKFFRRDAIIVILCRIPSAIRLRHRKALHPRVIFYQQSLAKQLKCFWAKILVWVVHSFANSVKFVGVNLC